MGFDAVISEQPIVMQLWSYWLALAVWGGILFFLTARQTRFDALLMGASAVGVVLGAQWVYALLGHVRLLALPEAVLWTPLAVYLRGRAERPDLGPTLRLVMLAVTFTIVIALAFDYAEIMRYFAGDERPPYATTLPPLPR